MLTTVQSFNPTKLRHINANIGLTRFKGTYLNAKLWNSVSGVGTRPSVGPEGVVGLPSSP